MNQHPNAFTDFLGRTLHEILLSARWELLEAADILESENYQERARLMRCEAAQLEDAGRRIQAHIRSQT